MSEESSNDAPAGNGPAGACTFFPLFGPDREVTHVAVAFKDVTAELRARQVSEAERDQLRAALEEKQRLARALHESEDRLRGTLEAAEVGTWELNVEDGRLEWSANVDRILGLEAATFDGTLDAALALTHPDDRPMLANEIRTALAERRAYETEFRVPRSDGSTAWLTARGNVVVDDGGTPRLVRGVVLDVTAQRRARETSKMHARVLESMTEGVSVANEQGFIIYTNPAEDRMFGYARGELVGLHVSVQNTYAEDENARIVADVIEHLNTRGEWEGEWSNVRKDGTAFTSQARITALELDGRPHFVCVQRDVTLRKRSQEFEQQVVAIVSHDPRNPLNAIGVSAALLLRRGGIDERQAKAISRILSSTDRAQRMIRDFLDFARARTGGGIPLSLREIDVYDAIRGTVDEVHLSYPERRIVVELDGDARATCDPDRVMQLVGNLVANALQHGDSESPVRIVGRADADSITVEVSNAGAPIPGDEIAGLFVPFRRGRDARHRAGGSIGLGLYITEQIVRAHGGTVSVRSTADAGTTFSVRLPRRAEEVSESV